MTVVVPLALRLLRTEGSAVLAVVGPAVVGPAVVGHAVVGQVVGQGPPRHPPQIGLKASVKKNNNFFTENSFLF